MSNGLIQINLDEKMRKELQDLGKDPELKKDAFYKQLEFGTAGMRGVLGPGVNRMNIFTIRQATSNWRVLWIHKILRLNVVV